MVLLWVRVTCAAGRPARAGAPPPGRAAGHPGRWLTKITSSVTGRVQVRQMKPTSGAIHSGDVIHHHCLKIRKMMTICLRWLYSRGGQNSNSGQNSNICPQGSICLPFFPPPVHSFLFLRCPRNFVNGCSRDHLTRIKTETTKIRRSAAH